MKSGMLAADKILTALQSKNYDAKTLDYRTELDESWVGKELKKTRNYRQGFHHGLLFGMAFTALQMVTGGKLPSGRWKIRPDHLALKPLKKPMAKTATVHDSKLQLDLLSDVHKSGTRHREEQPPHCTFKDEALIRTDHEIYGSPCTRFCPAKVYEAQYDKAGNFETIQINFSNCLHCKTCEIKDPQQNIQWNLPDGGDGPRWQKM
jgi:electron-transferring-flavoprotein dehydrogenase